MRKATVIIIIAAVLSLGLTGVVLGASYGGGTGEPNNPYQIADVNDFQTLTVDPNNWDKSFILTADIDLTGLTFTQAPIASGTYTTSGFRGTMFAGIFDGNGHTISNVTINQPSSDNVGLFGYIGDGSEIKNLELVDVNVIGRSFVGGLVGTNSRGTISNCYSSGIVNALGHYAGGLVGNNWEESVNNCHSSGTVSGNDCIGGLVGGNFGSMRNCYSIAAVSGTGFVGGLAGINGGGTISSCYSNGPVSAAGEGVGGLLGFNNWGTVVNCYSNGSTSGGDCVGGLAGGSNGTIGDCYSSGPVSASGDYAGGLIGCAEGGIVRNCFWDIYTSGQTASAVGQGRTTAQMKTVANYVGWNGGEVTWTIDENNDYPRLIWEGKPGTAIPSSSLSDTVSGSGTAEDPYMIYTALQLNTIGKYPAEWDKNYNLMADVDMSLYSDVGYNIIGSCNLPFTGFFDGNGHVASNLTFGTNGLDYAGLFGVTSSGSRIQDLGLVNFNITGGCGVGSLVGLNNGIVSNCYSSGQVNADTDIGGLVGDNRGDITDCYSSSTINGYSYVGGLVGENWHGIIRNCCSSGPVTASGNYIGGLVGNNDRESEIGNCYSSGPVSGGSNVGGLVGDGNGTDISKCYSTGLVIANGVNVGGLAGGWPWNVVPDSFWDIQTSGRTTSSGGIGMTTEEMKTLSTFADSDWDFTTPVWKICEGTNYPKLAWQTISVGDIVCPDGVETFDFAVFAAWWLENGCGDCGGADLTGDGVVDIDDLQTIAANWLN